MKKKMKGSKMSELHEINTEHTDMLSRATSEFNAKIKARTNLFKARVTVKKRKRKIQAGFNRFNTKFNMTVSKSDIFKFIGNEVSIGSFISTRVTLTIGLKETYFSITSNGNKTPVTKYTVDIVSDGETIYTNGNHILEGILHRAGIKYSDKSYAMKSNMSHVEYVIGKIAGVYVFTFDAPMSLLTESNKNVLVSYSKFLDILNDVKIVGSNYDIANTIEKYLRFVNLVTSTKGDTFTIDVRHQKLFEENPHIRGVIKYKLHNGFVDDSHEEPVISKLIEFYKYAVSPDEFRHFLNVIDNGILLEVTHVPKAKVQDIYLSSACLITSDITKAIPVSSDVKDLVFEGSDYGVTIFSPMNKPYFWDVNGIIHKIDINYGDNLSAVIWYRDMNGDKQRLHINESEFRHYNILSLEDIDMSIDTNYLNTLMKKKTIDVKARELDMKHAEISRDMLKISHDKEMFKMKSISEQEKNKFLLYSLELKLEELKTSSKINGVKQGVNALANIAELIKVVKSLII